MNNQDGKVYFVNFGTREVTSVESRLGLNFMENDRLQIKIRLKNIEDELNLIAGQVGLNSRELLINPLNRPLNVLKSMHRLIEEKLQLQKDLFRLNGGDLSNIVLLSERRINVY